MVRGDVGTNRCDDGSVTQPLASVYSAWTAHVVESTPERLARPSRAAAWTVKELLLHQLLDARRALVALATPADGLPDVDEVTYWRSFHPDEGEGGAAHARFVVACAAAYDREHLVEEWRATSAAATHAASSPTSARVSTQGHALTVEDLCSTLVVEATVHLLDAHGTPPADALEHTVEVLSRLRGRPLPADGADEVLRATGRLPSDEPDYPLLG